MDVLPWEKVLIGTVIDDPKAWVEVADIEPKSLQSRQHQIVWNRALELAMKDALSMRSLAESLRSSGELDGLGSGNATGEGFLEELVAKADPTALSEAKVQVAQAIVKRQLEDLGVKLTKASRNGKTPEEIIDEHMQGLLQVRIKGQREPRPIWTNKENEKQRISDIRNGLVPPALKPNLLALRDLIPGLAPTDFALISATPGSGKSSLMRFESYMWALQGKRGLVFSYENTLEEWQSWYVAFLTKINHKKVVFPELLTEQEHKRVDEAYDQLERLPINVEEMFGDPLTAIIAATRRHMMREPLDYIMIDGAYLIGSSGQQSEYERISKNMQGLRSFAQEVKVPILATTQFNRGVNSTKEPEQSQVLYSGENPARIMIGMVKKEMGMHEIMQFPENKGQNGTWRIGKSLRALVIQMSVMKQTNGEMGLSGDVVWIKHTNEFRDLPRDWNRPVRTEKLVQEQENVIKSYPKKTVRSYQKGDQLIDTERKK